MMYKVFFGIAFVLACFSSSSVFNAKRLLEVLGPGLLRLDKNRSGCISSAARATGNWAE